MSAREYDIAECKVFSAMLGGYITVHEYWERLIVLRLIYGVES